MSSTEIAKGFKKTNPGTLDEWYGPYATIEAANLAVPVPIRLGKVVGINTNDGIVDYWWAKSTANDSLVRKSSSSFTANRFNLIGFYNTAGILVGVDTWCSMLIEVNGGVIDYRLWSAVGANLLSYFDENKIYINGVAATAPSDALKTGTIVLPATVRYVGVSTILSHLADSSIKYTSSVSNLTESAWRKLTAAAASGYAQNEVNKTLKEVDLLRRFVSMDKNFSFPDTGFYLATGAFNSSTNWYSVKLVAGENTLIKYKVYSAGGTGPAAIITFFNDAGVKVGSSVDATITGLSYYEGEVRMPVGVAYAILSTNKDGLGTAYYIYDAFIKNALKDVEVQIPFTKISSNKNFPSDGFYTATGTFNGSTNWKSTRIYIPAGSVIDYSLLSNTGAALITYFDVNGVRITSVNATGSLVINEGRSVAPPNTDNAVITTQYTGVGVSYYSYTNRTENIFKGIDATLATKADKPVAGRILIVSKTGAPTSTSFNTVQAAISAWIKGDVINIYDGVYEEISLKIPDTAVLKGIGTVEIRGYLPVTATTIEVDAKSTIDFENSGTLENLVITAKNCRYPIHSDFGNPNATQRVINCKIIHYGNQEIYTYRVANGTASPNQASAVWRACSAWGCGSQAGSKIYLINCYIESTMRAFSTHNNLNYNLTGGASLIQCDDCTIVSHGIDRDGSLLPFVPSASIQSLSSYTDDKVVFNNCNINGYITLQSSSQDWREFTQDILGSGSSGHLMQIRHTVGSVKDMVYETTTRNVYVVKVKSNTADSITVSGNLSSIIFGNYIALRGSSGLNSYAKGKVGHISIWSAVNAYSGAKTITFVSGSDTKTITLNAVYTSTQNMVDDMNTKFGAGSFVAELYWSGLDWYPKFSNEISACRNTGTTAVLRGRAVKQSGYGRISLMKDSDLPSDFFGISVQDIPVGTVGDVKIKGYMLRIWVDGLFGTVLSDGDQIRVNADGSLSKSTGGAETIISKCVANENISINL